MSAMNLKENVLFVSQIEVSGEARAREPYGSRGDDETKCLTTLIKRHADFTIRNLTRGIHCTTIVLFEALS